MNGLQLWQRQLPSSPTGLAQTWSGAVLPAAIRYLIATSCFGQHVGGAGDDTWIAAVITLLQNAERGFTADTAALANLVDPADQHCFEHWQQCLAAGRITEDFFCRGPIETCVNCGAEWAGLAVVWHDNLAKGVCPGCSEPFEAQVLQKALWREHVGHTAGTQLVGFQRETESFLGSMLFHLVRFYLANNIVHLPTDPTPAQLSAAEYQLKELLDGLELNPVVTYQARSWPWLARFAELHGDDISQWSYRQLRGAISLARDYVERKASGDQQLVDWEQQVDTILQDPGRSHEARFRDAHHALSNKLKPVLLPPTYQATLLTGGNGTQYLLMAATPEDMSRLQMDKMLVAGHSQAVDAAAEAWLKYVLEND